VAGPEAQIEKTVTDFAVRMGWLSYKFTSPNRRAVPDRIYLRGATTFFIEFKAPGKAPSLAQTREHETLLNEGFAVYVVDDIVTGCEIIGRMD